MRIQGDNRLALERLRRYCARPALALEPLREIDAERLVYESVKPGAGGSVTLIRSLYCSANGEAAIVGRQQFIDYSSPVEIVSLLCSTSPSRLTARTRYEGRRQR